MSLMKLFRDITALFASIRKGGLFWITKDDANASSTASSKMQLHKVGLYVSNTDRLEMVSSARGEAKKRPDLP